VRQHFCRAFYFGLTANATFTVHIEIRRTAKKKTHAKENIYRASPIKRTTKKIFVMRLKKSARQRGSHVPSSCAKRHARNDG
jgi:hypothetical protein